MSNINDVTTVAVSMARQGYLLYLHCPVFHKYIGGAPLKGRMTVAQIVKIAAEHPC